VLIPEHVGLTPRRSPSGGGFIMIRIRWSGWRRDLLVAFLAVLLALSALTPISWAAVRQQKEEAENAYSKAEAAARLAEEKAAEAEQYRAQARRKLIDDAIESANFGEKNDAEVRRVSTGAVSPEVPENALLLIDRKATAYAVGDIVTYQVDEKTYLGRILAVDKAAGRFTLGRNGEPNREVAIKDVSGRGVLNTR
jgi:hypothetical protein